MNPGAVDKGVGQKRPKLGAALQHVKMPHNRGLLQSFGVEIGAGQQIAKPFRPKVHGETTRHESELANDRVHGLLGGQTDARMDGDENCNQRHDDQRRVKYRLSGFGRVRQFAGR